MSGVDVPYQLRPNKYIDRQVFIDILDRIGRVRPLNNYAYASMAGKFLDDHKSVHLSLNIPKLFSFEKEEYVVSRQLFNRPFGIKCICSDSRDFVETFPEVMEEKQADNYIVWLDFTSPSDRLLQLQQFEALISRMDVYDVARITINANVETVKGEDAKLPPGQSVRDVRLERFNLQLGMYPANPSVEEMIQKSFPRVLARSISRAASKGISGKRGLAVHPLGLFEYNDTAHTMLSVTCILLPHGNTDFLSNPAISSWQFLANNWEDVRKVTVPDLSLKEKFHIDQHLFDLDDEGIINSLGFQFDKDLNISISKIAHYRTMYKFYPQFARIA